MLDLGECQSLYANNSPSAVYLSPVQTPPPSNKRYFMFDQFVVRKAHIFYVPARNASDDSPMAENTKYWSSCPPVRAVRQNDS